MLPSDQGLTTNTILALASEYLSSHGFRVSRDLGSTTFPIDRTLLAEDRLSVLALVIFDTWEQLEKEWGDAQAELVSIITKALSKATPKAWDGYLILICANSAPNAASISLIERDTTRVRKIVATSDSLQTSADVRQLIDPFLPLPTPNTDGNPSDILDALPDLLKPGVPAPAMRAMLSAFKELEPLLESLSQWSEQE